MHRFLLTGGFGNCSSNSFRGTEEGGSSIRVQTKYSGVCYFQLSLLLVITSVFCTCRLTGAVLSLIRSCVIHSTSFSRLSICCLLFWVICCTKNLFYFENLLWFDYFCLCLAGGQPWRYLGHDGGMFILLLHLCISLQMLIIVITLLASLRLTVEC